MKEILLYFIIFSVVYEYISPMIYAKATGDWLDVFFYAMGGFVLWIIQNYRMKKHKKHGV